MTVQSRWEENGVKEADYAAVINACGRGARSATKYISPTMTVRATLVFKPRAADRCWNFVLSVGRPNYEAREFIRMCQKAGEPLPVKKVQVKGWPVRKRK